MDATRVLLLLLWQLWQYTLNVVVTVIYPDTACTTRSLPPSLAFIHLQLTISRPTLDIDRGSPQSLSWPPPYLLPLTRSHLRERGEVAAVVVVAAGIVTASTAAMYDTAFVHTVQQQA